MATHPPRIQVMLDEQTYDILASLAKRTDASKSSCAAQLIREALALHEDKLLSQWADQRYHQTTQWIGHRDVWEAP